MSPPGTCEAHDLVVGMIHENTQRIEANRLEAKRDAAKNDKVLDDIRKVVYMGMGAVAVLQIVIPLALRYFLK